MKNKICVSLGIWDFSDISHGDLTTSVGIEPTLIHVKNQPIKSGSRIASSDGWILESPAINDNIYSTFEEQMDALMKILEPKRDILKSICDKCYTEFSFTFYIYTDTEESTPVIHLTKQHTQFVSYLNAECDFDIILLSNEETEDDDDNW